MFSAPVGMWALDPGPSWARWCSAVVRALHSAAPPGGTAVPSATGASGGVSAPLEPRIEHPLPAIALGESLCATVALGWPLWGSEGGL